MKRIKIGLMTCSNATQDLNCCSVGCFRDFDRRAGAFGEYPADASLRMVGVISCAGCPTRVYPEKILKRVESLVEFGVRHLHFANCIVALCPFLKRYTDAIAAAYPDLHLVHGSHEAHISDDSFREKVACAFTTGRNMADVIRDRLE